MRAPTAVSLYVPLGPRPAARAAGRYDACPSLLPMKILPALSFGLSRIVRLLFTPFRRAGRLFCLAYFGVLLSTWLALSLSVGKVGLTPLCLLFDAYILALVGTVGGRYVRYVLGAVVAILLLIENYLVFTYDCQISGTLVGLVLQTDSRESAEFVTGTLTSLNFWTSVVATAAILAVSVWLLPSLVQRFVATVWPRWQSRQPKAMGRLCGFMTFVAVGLMVYAGVRQVRYYQRQVKLMHATSVQQFERVKGQVSTSPWMRLSHGLLMQRAMKQDYGLLDRTVAATRVDSVSYRSPLIVLIIGESYNKYFSPLYNPKALPTTPRLSALAASGDLAVYTDVVSPSNLTSQVFRSLFSLAQPEDPAWFDHTTFPALFKKAGYRVGFVSNQFVEQDLSGSQYDQAGGLLCNHGSLSRNQFTFRNPSVTRFDGDLLRQIPSADSLMQDGRPLLLIVHLIGQHMKYDMRYPTTADGKPAFSESDIHDGAGGRTGRRVRAHYANAVSYNDSVVGALFQMFAPYETVAIYLADHGEEVCDRSSFYGRLHTLQIDRELARLQYEVPFFVYLSPSYRERHPDVAAMVEQTRRRPYFTGDLSHTLLDLAGIRCADYDASRSLFSGTYNHSRRRLLKGVVDYDSLMAAPH